MTESNLSPAEGLFTVFTEIRKRILRSLIAMGLFATVGMVFSHDLILVLMSPFHSVMGAKKMLYFTAPSESMMAHMMVGIIAGFVAAAPYVFLQIWWVAAPAFYRLRRKTFMLFAMLSALTFVLGALFGYFGIMPVTIELLVKGFQTRAPFEAMLKISSFVYFSLKLLLAFGVAFELPVLMFLLGRLGVLDTRKVWRGFRYAVVGIFLIAGVLTPPDVATQLLVAVPLCLLYAAGAVAVTLFHKRQKKTELPAG